MCHSSKENCGSCANCPAQNANQSLNHFWTVYRTYLQTIADIDAMKADIETHLFGQPVTAPLHPETSLSIVSDAAISALIDRAEKEFSLNHVETGIEWLEIIRDMGIDYDDRRPERDPDTVADLDMVWEKIRQTAMLKANALPF